MGIFDSVVVDSDVQEQKESVGGGAKVEAGTYTAKIVMAKLLKSSSSSAMGISIEAELENGAKIWDSMWVTNKDGQPYYIDKEGAKKELPSYSQAKRLNQLLTGVIGLPSDKEMTIEVKGEPTKANVFTEWVNKPIGICVKIVMQDKYNDESSYEERPTIKHYYDPVDERFASEKPEGEPKKLSKFREQIEKGNTTEDKRKNSKGGGQAQEKTSVKNVGF